MSAVGTIRRAVLNRDLSSAGASARPFRARTCPRRGDAAARQFYEREAHLRVPRKHVETIVGEDQEERELNLGSWIGNQRSRAATPAIVHQTQPPPP
ncbi:hypothetical protein BIV25_39140 [Streptomyces sp. MUSC 14]|nr:hypothetical protein BIV25_39140 [Streptomyces sp. MUSC 14]